MARSLLLKVSFFCRSENTPLIVMDDHAIMFPDGTFLVTNHFYCKSFRPSGDTYELTMENNCCQYLPADSYVLAGISPTSEYRLEKLPPEIFHQDLLPFYSLEQLKALIDNPVVNCYVLDSLYSSSHSLVHALKSQKSNLWQS